MVISLARPSQPIMDLVFLIGMNQTEAAEYLTAHGIKTSPAAVKAWATDKYSPKPQAILLLWALWLIVENGGELPPHVPPSVVRRQAAILKLRAQVAALEEEQVMSDEPTDTA